MLALLSALVERVGAAPASWRDELCSPFPLHPCDEGVLQGGWPLGYLLDRPGISVMARLGFVEDLFIARRFFLDVAAFWVALASIAWLGRRRPSEPPR